MSENKLSNSPSEKIPENLDECLRFLIAAYEDGGANWQRFKEMDEREALGRTHFSTGQMMRNRWGLWAGSPLSRWFNSVGIDHPDDMSGIILTSFHRKLNGQKIDLDGQIKKYQDYWNGQRDETQSS